nr:uncharacterized protein LOC133612756 isoform X5 [Nerophis lumbriciformis]
METKQQDATFLQGCHRGFGLLLPGEDAPRAGRVEQLLPLTGLEDVHEQGGEERMLQQCFMHLEDITLQLLHYYQRKMSTSEQVQGSEVPGGIFSPFMHHLCFIPPQFSAIEQGSQRAFPEI